MNSGDIRKTIRNFNKTKRETVKFFVHNPSLFWALQWVLFLCCPDVYQFLQVVMGAQRMIAEAKKAIQELKKG